MLTRPLRTRPAAGLDCGEYYHSDSRLFRVEWSSNSRVLIEDCLTEELFDVAVSDLDRLTPTQPVATVRETAYKKLEDTT